MALKLFWTHELLPVLKAPPSGVVIRMHPSIYLDINNLFGEV